MPVFPDQAARSVGAPKVATAQTYGGAADETDGHRRAEAARQVLCWEQGMITNSGREYADRLYQLAGLMGFFN